MTKVDKWIMWSGEGFFYLLKTRNKKKKIIYLCKGLSTMHCGKRVDNYTTTHMTISWHSFSTNKHTCIWWWFLFLVKQWHLSTDSHKREGGCKKSTFYTSGNNENDGMNLAQTLTTLYISIIVVQRKSSSSSLSCHTISTDIPDPFLPLFSIIHCFWLVFRATSCISTELLYVDSSWSSCLCSSMWRSPQEHVTYEFVPTSPAVSHMSGSSHLDSFRIEW